MHMKNTGVQRVFSRLRGGGPLAAGILLFLAVFAACVLYVGLITKPMDSFDIALSLCRNGGRLRFRTDAS